MAHTVASSGYSAPQYAHFFMYALNRVRLRDKRLMVNEKRVVTVAGEALCLFICGSKTIRLIQH